MLSKLFDKIDNDNKLIIILFAILLFFVYNYQKTILKIYTDFKNCEKCLIKYQTADGTTIRRIIENLYPNKKKYNVEFQKKFFEDYDRNFELKIQVGAGCNVNNIIPSNNIKINFEEKELKIKGYLKFDDIYLQCINREGKECRDLFKELNIIIIKNPNNYLMDEILGELQNQMITKKNYNIYLFS